MASRRPSVRGRSSSLSSRECAVRLARGRYGAAMAAPVKKLDVHVGDVVEIDTRRYGVVSDPLNGVALEPVITHTVAEIRGELDLRPLSVRGFDTQFGDLPVDGEG